nr:uncharacterized protein LOC111982910 [Quercus suber]
MPQVSSGDAMGKALHQISQSSFSKGIEKTNLPHRFIRPTFIIYDGKMDLVEHVNHYNQSIAIYSKNEALMCKIFLSSLGPIAMRWFGGLEKGSVQGYDELIKAFRARFVTCNRILKPFASLFTMAMKQGETFVAYLDCYWELYNEIEEDNGGIAASTFKVGLLIDFDLRASLALKPVMDMNKLMERVEEYKRLEDN